MSGTNWANDLAVAYGSEPRTSEKAEPDFYSSKQWAKRWDKSLSHTMALIAQMMDRGEMDRKCFAQFTGHSNRLWPVPHYREK